MSPEQFEEAAPPAGALIEALRGLGYSLPTAIADLIDNSISAKAQNVWITFWWSGADSWISILDDGRGMSEAELREAMRPGNRNPLEVRDPQDLGRFGLGLKTASFSQCRRVTVASRQQGQTAIRRWDLDYVSRADRWRVLFTPHSGSESRLASLDDLDSGTLVLWEVLDRVVGDVRRDDRAAQDRFLRRINEVEAWLAMVFHRYLDGAGPKLQLFVSGGLEPMAVASWDPFLEKHPATLRTPEESISLADGVIRVQGFVLPHKDRLGEEAHAAAAGPTGWNDQQGFYVYRNERLLVAGSWLGLGRNRPWTKEEHYKLARIRLDIPNTMDAAWKIDVRKSTARPPDLARARLKELAEYVRQQAREVFAYRGRGGRRASGSVERAWEPVTVGDRLRYRIHREHPLVKHVLQNSGPLKASVQALLRLLEETVPVQQIWLDVAERQEPHAAPFSCDADLEVSRILSQIFRALLSQGCRSEEARARLLRIEPFQSYPHLVAALPDEI